MKYFHEFHDPVLCGRWAGRLAARPNRPWMLMEVCGGQTHAIIRHGLDQLLPPSVELIHGPGCPVCVTPPGLIDAALELAARPGVTLCSFGDMVRVPGGAGDLLSRRAEGADVRIVTAPHEALRLAGQLPDREIVLFAIGFETTAPVTAASLLQARRAGLTNFSILSAHVTIVPAVEAIAASPECRLNGLLAPGHVCAVTGSRLFEPFVERHRIPVVVTGFEPADILAGFDGCLAQLEEGRAEVVNAYPRAVRREGNPTALDLMERVFERADRAWRGLGTIPASGLALREAFTEFDATRRFRLEPASTPPPSPCISDRVLTGRARPTDCPAFGRECTPERPLGATMVSGEGACAAYYKFRRSHDRGSPAHA